MNSEPHPAPPPPSSPPPPLPRASEAPLAKKTTQQRALLLNDIRTGMKLHSSKHLMNDRSGLLVESSESSDRLKRINLKKSVSCGEDTGRNKPDESSLTNYAKCLSKISLNRANLNGSSNGTIKKPPVPGNKPCLLRSSSGQFGNAISLPDRKSLPCQPVVPINHIVTCTKKLLEAESRVGNVVKPPVPPAKPLFRRINSTYGEGVSGTSRPASFLSDCSSSLQTSSFESQEQTGTSLPPRVASTESNIKTNHPQSTVAHTHLKNVSDRVCLPISASAEVAQLDLIRDTNRAGTLPRFRNCHTDLSFKASTTTMNKSDACALQMLANESQLVTAEQSSSTSSIQTLYDKDFEAQFRFHRTKELPPPDKFKNSHKTYPSKNPKNPANRKSFAAR